MSTSGASQPVAAETVAAVFWITVCLLAVCCAMRMLWLRRALIYHALEEGDRSDYLQDCEERPPWAEFNPLDEDDEDAENAGLNSVRLDEISRIKAFETEQPPTTGGDRRGGGGGGGGGRESPAAIDGGGATVALDVGGDVGGGQDHVAAAVRSTPALLSASSSSSSGHSIN